jgi:ArsR family transcriptional regulator
MEQNVQLYKSLADETRLRILSLLLSEGELCVCDLIGALQLPQSTVSRHLAMLRKSGWVQDRRCGIWIYYSIRADSPAQRELIPILKQQLADCKTAAIDRQLLASFGQGNHCA